MRSGRSPRASGRPSEREGPESRDMAIQLRSQGPHLGARLLYEIRPGQTPFHGETVSDTIAGVLGWEPDWEPNSGSPSCNPS